jgi:hypothetical protein
MKPFLYSILAVHFLLTDFYRETYFMTEEDKRKVTATVTRVEHSVRNEKPFTQIDYRVVNTGDKPVWMVDDGWLTWQQQDKLITLSLKRERMQQDAEAFGYFAPKLAEIPPGGLVERSIELSWPVSLSRLWNKSDKAAPPPGEYELELLVGYGVNKSILKSKPVQSIREEENRIMKWQNMVYSNKVILTIPVY